MDSNFDDDGQYDHHGDQMDDGTNINNYNLTSEEKKRALLSWALEEEHNSELLAEFEQEGIEQEEQEGRTTTPKNRIRKRKQVNATTTSTADKAGGASSKKPKRKGGRTATKGGAGDDDDHHHTQVHPATKGVPAHTIEINERGETIVRFTGLDIKTKPNPTEGPVRLSRTDKAAPIILKEDGLTAIGEKGYRMIRATHGALQGAWYCEVKINDHKGNTRLGWATFRENINLPVGFSDFSYSYRDSQGTKFHKSVGQPYGEPYGPGDVIGMYIYLNPETSSPHVKQITEEFRHRHSKYYIVREEEIVEESQGSKIIFFKNGVSQGVAFENINRGRYYPAASLYNEASVTFNFGPKFEFPPQMQEKDGVGFDYRPISELFNPQDDEAAKTAVTATITAPSPEVKSEESNASDSTPLVNNGAIVGARGEQAAEGDEGEQQQQQQEGVTEQLYHHEQELVQQQQLEQHDRRYRTAPYENTTKGDVVGYSDDISNHNSAGDIASNNNNNTL